jgi:parallel beta-helix repeat protein
MTIRRVSILGVGVLLGSVPVAGLPAFADSHPQKVFVSSSGACGGRSAVAKISAAVNAVAPGGTVQVCPGTYVEDVVVTQPVTLQGANAVVAPSPDDASPLSDLVGNNAFTVLSANVTIRGFTVQGATGDGILLLGDHALVENNLARNNGNDGINVDGSSYSTIRGNTVTSNNGGIELANDPAAAGIELPGVTGTASHDLVVGNSVVENPFACGIFLVDHAGTQDGTLNMQFGIHDNVVQGNTITNNAMHGWGSGVLLATGMPGGAVYNNVVRGNTIDGNGLAGVTVHSHTPNEYLDGNVVTDNNIGTNNLRGFLEPDDPQTTGVFIGSQNPLTISVSGNTVHDDHYGIFTAGADVTVTGATSNTFTNVTEPFGSKATFEQ